MAKKVTNKSVKSTAVANRIAQLKAAGINTEGMLSVADASGNGFVMKLVNGKLTMVDASGNPVSVKAKTKKQAKSAAKTIADAIVNTAGINANASEYEALYADIESQIIENGYVKNTKLFRRWVMAQMFRMLKWRSWNGTENGFNACLRHYGYKYQWEMVVEELRVIAKLEALDDECYRERSRFFTKDVLKGMFQDYLEKITAKVDGLSIKHCQGREYKRISRWNDVFCDEIDAKVYKPIRIAIRKIDEAQTAQELYDVVSKYDKKRAILNNWDTSLSTQFVDAFKGAGAFYTMKNMILFHNCNIHDDNGAVLGKYASLAYINEKADEYQNGGGWRLFAVMKKLIKDNREALGSWAEGLNL